MMKKHPIEIIASMAFVLGGTLVAYGALSGFGGFWNAQGFWNFAMLACWAVVAVGYWRQGMLVQKSNIRSNISFFLPCAVFFVQCTLFVKGVYYHDTALVIGALLVNSAVTFYLYQLFKNKFN